MAQILVVYHTVEGQSALIADRLAGELRSLGDEVTVAEAKAAPASLEGFDGVVLGGSIHMGKHGAPLSAYVRDHQEPMRSRPNAFFSVSMSAARRDEKHQADAQRIANEFLDGASWKPDRVALFAGAVKYTKYNFITRRLMRWISSKEGGETDMSRDWEYTDWAAVKAFADDLHQLVTSRLAAAGH